MGAGEGEPPQRADELLGRAEEEISVGIDQRLGDLLAARACLDRVLVRLRWTDHAHRRHQGEGPAEADLQERHVVEQPLAQRLLALDVCEVEEERFEVQGVLDCCQDEVVLGVEDAKDRAFGHPSGLRDLARGDRTSVLVQQGQGGVDQGLAAYVRREGLGAGGSGLRHSGTLSE